MIPPDPRLEAYLELCQRLYERMLRDGTWLWREPLDQDEQDDQPKNEP